MRQFLLSVLDVCKVVLLAVGTVLVVRNFVVQPFLVMGQSMIPTFHGGDYLLIDELTYRFREPQRGEVVVFRSPSDKATYYIKRIIGLPGERIEIQNGKVAVFGKNDGEGRILEEQYLPRGVVTSGASVELHEDQYFVLGDNRPFSFDSRSWGPVARSDVVGIVRLRLWPFGQLAAFAAPQY